MRRNAALRDLAEALRVETVVTGDPHAHARSRVGLQDALVAIRNRTSLDGCERERRGNHESILLAPEEMHERFPDDRDAVERTGELAQRLEFDLTQDLGYMYPDFSDRDEPAIKQLRTLCDRLFRERYASANGHKRRARAAPRRGARPDRAHRPRRLLPPALGGARARARSGAGGARRVGRAAGAAAGTRPRLVRRLDRLLPHRPLARRSRRRRSLARPLPQRRAVVGARHRPRLPPRHPRAADRARDGEVRPRARGARRVVRDVSLARRDPRRRQGARAAVRRPRTARARSPTAGTRRACATSSARYRTPRRSSPRRAGARSWSCAPRSPACRATSRSTPAAWSSRRGR